MRFTTLLSLSVLTLLPLAAPGQGVPKAVPLDDAEPSVPRAVPVAPEEARRAVPAEPMAAPKPKGPDEDLFDYATLAYDRSEWGIAAESLGKYLQDYPSGRHVATALFRIGECYMKQNQMKAAETYYEEVVKRYPESEGAPSAAYRLGALRFNARDFDQSARMFSFSESRSKLPQVRLAASFNKARAYQMLGDTKRQMAALNNVLMAKTDNPYREAALLSLGTLYLAGDKKAEALPLFTELIQSSKDNAVIAEASVKAGVLHAEMGKPELAVPLFEQALKNRETSEGNRSIALVGVVQALFAKGDYDGVIHNYNANAAVLPEGDTRPKMLLMVGNAFRMKKSYARAVETYLMVEQAGPTTEAAFEAGYWKLYCFYLLDDKDLAEFATNFIVRNATARPDHEFMNLARLIRADHYFNKQNYKEASTSFAEVKLEKLPAKLQPGTLFNKAWSLAESARTQEAIGAFTQFLDSHPAHELVPRALARRGLAYRDAKDTPNALSDFRKVVETHPNSDAVELAYLQMGLIAAEARDHKAAVAAYEMLVKKFPTSPAAAQAWFGIGRARFALQEWAACIEALQKCISIDKKTYLDSASQMIIQAWYVQQNAEELGKAVDDYKKANANAVVPPNILTWLGITLFNRKNYSRSAHFLTAASTPDAPENTDQMVWNYLGQAFLQTGDYESSIKATEHFLKNTPEGAAKARALHTKSSALLGLGKFDEAEAVVQEGLSFAKDGKPQAMLLILQGDILAALGDKLAAEGQQAAAHDKFGAAAGKYMIPAQFFDDEQITPEALEKAAKALEKSGQTEKAADFRRLLKEKYPAQAP